MDVPNTVLEYFRVFLSTPVISGAIAIIVLVLFQKDIRSMFGRIATIKLPGGSELSISQQLHSANEPAIDNQPDVSDEEVKVPKELGLSSEQMDKIRRLYLNERANAHLWEYRYLNHYLVRSSHYVLEWIAGTQEPVSLSLFDNIWGGIINSVSERQAIIDALQSHHLVQISDQLIKITPKGREYIEWRSPTTPTGS